ncbi:lantibiotic immunity ABC transporter MutG family permease subunit [Romboutsia ilealis]|nr:lantibiotic immunity ABC transporter MutG family permease subunit [Romboutsia ilealis]
MVQRGGDIGMWRLINCLKADFYKFYHSNIIKVHLIIPISTVITFLAYYVISSWDELQKFIAYIQLISISFPFIISIIVNMVYEQEQEAGFQYFLGIANKKYIAHFSKFITIFILGLISTLIAILGFGIIFYLIENNLTDIELYFRQSFIMFGSNIIIYMIQYLAVFYFGKGASIGLGIVGSLISALMLTGIGDGIWPIVPWVYSVRLCSYFIMYNSSTLMENQSIIHSMIMMIIYMVTLLVLQLIFINYWEGRRENY